MTKVLIIEDHEDSALTLALYLEMLGFETAVAHTGQAGLDAARSDLPTVIICDLGLPVLDGYKVAQQLRSELGSSCPYLIAVSGYDRPEDRLQSKESGFAAHFAKPVDLSALEDKLKPFFD